MLPSGGLADDAWLERSVAPQNPQAYSLASLRRPQSMQRIIVLVWPGIFIHIDLGIRCFIMQLDLRKRYFRFPPQLVLAG